MAFLIAAMYGTADSAKTAKAKNASRTGADVLEAIPGGIMRLNDTSKIQYDEEYGFWTEKVKAIHEDNEGDIWIGTEGKGLGIYTYKNDKDTIYAYYYHTDLPTTNLQLYISSSSRRALKRM